MWKKLFRVLVAVIFLAGNIADVTASIEYRDRVEDRSSGTGLDRLIQQEQLASAHLSTMNTFSAAQGSQMAVGNAVERNQGSLKEAQDAIALQIEKARGAVSQKGPSIVPAGNEKLTVLSTKKIAVKDGYTVTYEYKQDDGFGNITLSRVTETYRRFLGRYKMVSSDTTSHTDSVDGSSQDQHLLVNYTHDRWGFLKAASGSGRYSTHDGFGKTENGVISQTYKIILGRAKLATHTTTSHSLAVVGSSEGRSLTVTYVYDRFGNLTKASGTGEFSSNDGYGNAETGTISQSYVIINRQAKLSASTTQVHSQQSDGSTREQVLTTQYKYDRGGRLVGVSGDGTFVSDDGFGNTTQGTIVQTYAIIKGLVKLASTITESMTMNRDGSYQNSRHILSNSYDDNGRLTGALAMGDSLTSDGFGNMTEATSEESYLAFQGELKLKRSVTMSCTYSIVGFDLPPDSAPQNLGPVVITAVEKRMRVIENSYDRTGRLIGKTESSSYVTTDDFGNVTEGTESHEYKILNGKPLVASTIKTLSTTKWTGAAHTEEIRLQYEYDSRGRLLAISGEGTFASTDVSGGMTYGIIAQEYTMLNGLPRLSAELRMSESVNLDGSTRQEELLLSFAYDQHGNLVGKTGSGIFASDDGFGNQTMGTIDQTYSIIRGQAKITESRELSHTQNVDGSSQDTDMTTYYGYDKAGILVEAYAYGVFTSDDGHGNVTVSEIKIQYHVVNGEIVPWMPIPGPRPLPIGWDGGGHLQATGSKGVFSPALAR